jgi:Flp pilus assembly pilin Flp
MRLLRNQAGQGLVEYTLIVVLVALIFWVAVRSTNIDEHLKNAWADIGECLSNPFTCAQDEPTPNP